MPSLNIQAKLTFTGHIGIEFQSLFWRVVIIESKDCFSHDLSYGKKDPNKKNHFDQ